MKRNLYYNCAPIAASEGEWRDNVKTLCRYGDIFNGQKIVVVRTGDIMSDPQEVRDLFAQEGMRDIDFRLRDNHPVLHEGANFSETLESLHTLDPEEVTFYAHTKGVRVSEPEEMRRVSILQWRNRMYYECLHDAERIDAALSKYSSAGCYFMLKPYAHKRAWTRWMYAGTFYWFNHAALFSKDNWRYTGPKLDRFMTENYLGIHIDPEEAYSFTPKMMRFSNPYQAAVVDVRCPRCERVFETSLRKARRRSARCCRRFRFQHPEIVSWPDLGPVVWK